MKARFILGCFFSALCCCLLLWWGMTRRHQATEYSALWQQYYRAVHVLRQINPAAAEEAPNLPQNISRDDQANALIFHSDPIFVLSRIIPDLESGIGRDSQARVYAAYARFALGQPEKAAQLLSAHVAENPYQARHYELLCSALSRIGDYPALYLSCLEWREKDQSCRRNRLTYTWEALIKLQRPREACALMRGQGRCLGPEAALYAARGAQLDGDEGLAARIIREAEQEDPAAWAKLGLIWDRWQSAPEPRPNGLLP